jgi:hypothetical protein
VSRSELTDSLFKDVSEEKELNQLMNFENSVFEDESKYFKSVSVDLNSHELKKV